MDAKTVIDSYTNTVARRLPRGMRNEVGLELRALLAQALNDAAAETGREPDGDLALDVLRKLGRPDVVAARYAPNGFTVIEPEHGPWFVRLAVVGAVVFWVIALSLGGATISDDVVPDDVIPGAAVPGLGFWWISWLALGWIGLLTAWFAAAGWAMRRWPIDPHNFVRPWQQYIFWVPSTRDWLPGLARSTALEPEQVAYPRGARRVVWLTLLTLLVVVFAAPELVLGFVLPGDASWLRYNAAFQDALHMPLIALMVVRLALYVIALFNESFRERTEWLRLGLWIAFVGMLAWVLLGWTIFGEPPSGNSQEPASAAPILANLAFKLWLSIFVLVNALAIAAAIYRKQTSVRLPKTLYRAMKRE